MQLHNLAIKGPRYDAFAQALDILVVNKALRSRHGYVEVAVVDG